MPEDRRYYHNRQHRRYYRAANFGNKKPVFAHHSNIVNKQSVSNSKNTEHTLIAFLDRQEQPTRVQFNEFILRVKSMWIGEPSRLIELEFMLHIWYITFDADGVQTSKKSEIKQFISQHGDSLSQITELLPYFALPYVDNVSEHPFLRNIYTKEWLNKLKNYVENFILSQQKSVKSHQKVLSQVLEQKQWLSIVNDLIGICLTFASSCDLSQLSHLQMMERVKRYQQVIENNKCQDVSLSDSMPTSELSRLMAMVPVSPDRLEGRSSKHQLHCNHQIIDTQNQVLHKIDYQLIKQYCAHYTYNEPRNGHKLVPKQVTLIFHALSNRVKSISSLSTKKQQLAQYILEDIFNIQGSSILCELPSHIFEIQALKLSQLICILTQGRKYLCGSHPYIYGLSGIITGSADRYIELLLTDSTSQQLTYIQFKLAVVFNIVQKLSMQKSFYNQYLRQSELAATLVQSYLAYYWLLPEHILTYLLALVVNVCLHSEGRRFYSAMLIPRTYNRQLSRLQPPYVSFCLFELMCEVWQKLLELNSALRKETGQYTNETSQQVQSLIYSIFYLLLSQQSNRSVGRSIGFQSMLQHFIENESQQYYQKIVRHLLEKLATCKTSLGSHLIDSDSESDNQAQDEDEDDELIDHNEVESDHIWDGDLLYESTDTQKFSLQLGESFLQKYCVRNRQNSAETQNLLQISNIRSLHPNCSEIVDMGIQATGSSETVKDCQAYDPSKYQTWKQLNHH